MKPLLRTVIVGRFVVISGFILWINYIIIYFLDITHLQYLFFSFQLPDLFNQFKESMNAPSPIPVASSAPPLQSFVQPSLPISSVPVAAAPSVGPPAIDVLHDSDSDPDLQSLTIPFRSASSELFLAMISTDDAWINNLELRWICALFYVTKIGCFLKTFARVFEFIFKTVLCCNLILIET